MTNKENTVALEVQEIGENVISFAVALVCHVGPETDDGRSNMVLEFMGGNRSGDEEGGKSLPFLKSFFEKNNRENVTSFSSNDVDRLQMALDANEGNDSFLFDGKEYDTGYAKYLIEYLRSI